MSKAIESKRIKRANLTEDFDEMQIADAVKLCVWPQRGRPTWTVKELAALLRISERQVYRKLGDDADWTTLEISIIMRESIRLGGSPLLELLLPEGFEIISAVKAGKGFCRDLAEETREIGDSVTALERGDIAACEKGLTKADRTIRRMKADAREQRVM